MPIMLYGDVANLEIKINGKLYFCGKHGIFVLVENESDFYHELVSSKEVMYVVAPERYADYEFYLDMIRTGGSTSKIEWAIFLTPIPNGRVAVKTASVCVGSDGFKMKIDSCTDVENIEQLIKYLNAEDDYLQRIVDMYIKQGNYLLDIKKLLFPYKTEVLSEIEKSSLSGCKHDYKYAVREMYLMRPIVLKEFKKVVNEFDKYSENRKITIKSLNSILSNFKDHVTDIKNKRYNGFKGCYGSFMDDFEHGLQQIEDEFYCGIWKNQTLKEYMILFLEYNFYNQLNERLIVKPDRKLYEIHMGKNRTAGKKNIRSLYITPRFREGRWENDESEIRRVKFVFYTIGHLLSTGLVMHTDEGMELIKRKCFEDWIEIFYPTNELEKDEIQFVECYLEYVRKNKDRIDKIPLLIPQFRFYGLEEKHKYRADFLLLNYLNNENTKNILIELSRNTLHDSQGENDSIRRNDFIQEYDCITLEFRDREMQDMKKTFMERIVSKGYLE